MQTHRWPLSSAAQLTELYNHQTAHIPACYPLSPHTFQQGIHTPPTPTYPYKTLQLEADQLIIGETNGKITAFVHIATLQKETISGQTTRIGLIRFLTYPSNQRSLGQALLTEAENYCRKLKLKQIEAFSPASYPFYCLNSRSLSSKMGHVLALLGLNGYQITPKYFFMGKKLAAENTSNPAQPDASLHVTATTIQTESKWPNLQLRLWHHTNPVGLCNTTSVGTFCQADSAQDHAYTTWIKVEPQARNQGLARYLLQKNCFELQKIGYQFLYADVRCTNYQAQMLHLQAGYHLLDTKYEALKELTP